MFYKQSNLHKLIAGWYFQSYGNVLGINSDLDVVIILKLWANCSKTYNHVLNLLIVFLSLLTMYSLHVLKECLGTVFRHPLSRVKIARGSLFSFLGYFSLVVKLFQHEGLCPSKSPATVSCHLGWSLNSDLCLYLRSFSVSISCEPNKNPLAMAACTLLSKSCRAVKAFPFLLGFISYWLLWCLES